MAKFQVDRDVSYMKKTWGTTSLITDYGSLDFGRFAAALDETERKKTERNERTSNTEK